MDSIKIAFSKEDTEMIEILKNTFGDKVQMYEKKSLTGFEILFVAIIPTVGVTISVVDFLYNHFAKPENKGRVIIDKNGKIDMEGYTKDEVIAVYNAVKGAKNEKGRN